ncbi:quinon protein alcohol dehydrogenase-like superfamily [Flagelloscypha sp. PMI_526]|nr:quinon protein alcohol dehydrogenase-like superfamily [Flagelloscypha sp. PMI_526]
MSNLSSKMPGLMLLSLDGGRWQTLSPISQIEIVGDVLSYYECDHRLEPGTFKVCDAFDLVIGTGTGGLIAFMFSVLKLSIQDAKDAYIQLYRTAFAPESISREERGWLLRSALKELLDIRASGSGSLNAPLSLTKMRDIKKKNDGCKCAITAMSAANTASPVLLRTYQGRNASVNCLPLEVLLATLADIEFFPAVEIGTEEFISSNLGYFNPSEELLKEAASIFPSDTIAAIVSIGAGRPPPVSVNDLEGFPRAVVEHAIDCQAASDRIKARFSRHPGLYIRLEVDTISFNERNETRTSRCGSVISHSRAYLKRDEVRGMLEGLSRSLTDRPNRLKTRELSGPNAGVMERIEERLLLVFLDKLEVSRHAPYNSPAAQIHRRTCTPNTRVTILQEIISWAKYNIYPPLSSLFWIFGLAGTGKSTIAQSVCEILKKEALLASSYFCSVQFDSEDSKRIVPTIASHLAACFPVFAKHLAMILRRSPECASARIPDQFRDLLCVPWDLFNKEVALEQSYIVVLDALDECDNSEEVLRLILDSIDQNRLQGVRFLATSRPVPRLVEKALKLRRGPQIALHEVGKEEVSGDIRLFLEEELHGKVGPAEIRELTARSNGLFIFASTLVKHLIPNADYVTSWELQERLGQILEPGPQGTTVGLDALYNHILHGALSLEKFGHEGFRKRLSILQAVVSMEQATTTRVISDLLGHDVQDVTGVVNDLHSVLFTRGSCEPVYVIHASFRDFVVSRAQEPFRCDPSSIHYQLAQSCLSQMHTSLKFNICNIESSFTTNDDLSDTLNSIGESLAYVCRHWWAHLRCCTEAAQEVMRTSICQMMEEKGIFWIEVMTLLGDERCCRDILIEIAVQPSMAPRPRTLEKLIPKIKRDPSRLQALALEAANMVSMFMLISPKMTSHLYLSVLSLWEATNLQCWKSQFQKLPHVHSRRVDGSRSTRIICNVGSEVSCVAYSPNGKSVVSGSHDKTVRLWDAEIGKEILKLDGHEDKVTSVAFSPNGKHIASGSCDKTVRIWNIGSSMQIWKLDGHRDTVNSVAFSPSGKQVVSASTDKSVRIWDTESGKQLRRLNGHEDLVRSVAFSPSGHRIVSGSRDKTVRIWDAESGRKLQMLVGHSSQVTSVKFSPDGKRVVSGSDNTMRVWDAESGKKLRRLDGYGSRITSVAFSPDGQRIVSGSEDAIVRIWNEDVDTRRIWDADVDTLPILNTGISKESQKLDGHGSRVTSVAFSPNGRRVVSGSYDKTVRFWDGEPSSQLRRLNGHEYPVSSVTFSPDGKRVVSGSYDATARIWDAESGEQLRKLDARGFPVNSVTFSSDSKRIISGSDKMRIWDAESGKSLLKLNSSAHSVISVAFSPDGKAVVSGACDSSVQIWDTESGKMLLKLEGHGSRVNSVAFSPDGKFVVSGSDDTTIRIWDAGSGKRLQRLNRHGLPVTSVAFSPNGKTVISGSDDMTVQIWDAEFGTQFQRFHGHESRVTSVAFSPDGQYAVSGSDDMTVRIWDVVSGKQVRNLCGHASRVTSVAFSPEGLRVISASDDATLLVWDAQFDKHFWKLSSHVSPVASVTSSSDHECIPSGFDDGALRIWDAESRRLHQRDARYGDAVISPSISSNGFNETTGRIWDVKSGKYTGDLEILVRSVSFYPSTTTIVPHVEHFYDTNLHIRHTSVQSLLFARSKSTFRDPYLLYLSPTSTSIFARQDGWVVTSKKHTGVEHRIIWLPPSLRPFYPFILMGVSKTGFNRINMHGCTFGDGWYNVLHTCVANGSAGEGSGA